MCLDEIRRIFEFPEHHSVIELVERYRDFWRPRKGRLTHVLLAESHMWTPLNEINFVINNNIIGNAPIDELINNNYPQNFVRYVYCLAYGENELINNVPADFSNRGTSGYWELFYSCVHDIRPMLDNDTNFDIIFQDVLKGGTPDFNSRINNKVDLLCNLKKNGIWLVDSSFVGVNKLIEKLRVDIIKKCWELKIQGLLENIVGDFKILTIGKTVDKALRSSSFYTNRVCGVVDQPVFISHEKKKIAFRKCFEFCNNV